MPDPCTIIFCGTASFAVPSLKALASDSTFQISLVITQPDRPAGRGSALAPSPVKITTQTLGLPLLQPEDINTSLRANPFPSADFLVVVAYGQILTSPLLRWPKVAPVNLHASLLPRWRGASPIQHAILAGDQETGVTVQMMVEEVDAGPILAQERTPIGPRETWPTLDLRLAELGANLLVRTLTQPFRPLPQSTEGVTRCRKLTKGDGIIDPETMTAEEVDRRVRALSPWPGVMCAMHGHTVKLIATSLDPVPDSLPLSCKETSTLYVTEVLPPGKRPMSSAAWMRGLRHRGKGVQ